MEHVLPLRFQGAGEPMAAAPRLLIPARPDPQLVASVIIPAKNEATNLRKTLAALAAQVDLEGNALNPHSYEIIVLANNCRDRTAAVARRFAQAHPGLVLHVAEITLPPAQAHIGKARRLLMDEACRRLELVLKPGSFIASTDADTCVASTWLAAIQAELAVGADAVGGRILTVAPRKASCAIRRQHLRDATYRLLRSRLESLIDPNPSDPWPRHHQHFGASFAVTALAYRRVGGLPAVECLEDEALYRALRRHDLKVRHSPLVRVLTSDRRTGRVAVGLSWQLRQWAILNQKHREPLVESNMCLLYEWQARRQLRTIWRSLKQGNPLPSRQVLCPLAYTVAVPLAALQVQLQQADTFGKVWQWIEHRRATLPGWYGRWPLIPISQALEEMRQLIKQYESSASYGFSNRSSR